MDIKMISKAVKNIKPGVFTRITYKSEMPLKAEYKKLGYKIIKITSVTTRFGIHYGNIKDVKENKSEGKMSNKINNFVWIIKNNIQYNKNTKNYYLCTYPTKKGRNSSTKYDVYLNEEKVFSDIDFIDKAMIIDSYWNKNASNMMKINIDNVIAIGGTK